MKKAGIIGIIILLVLGLMAINSNKKTTSKNIKAKQPQTTSPERRKVRNEALIYTSSARRKAQQGDIQGAIEDCNMAVKIAPKEPVAQSCRRIVENLKKK